MISIDPKTVLSVLTIGASSEVREAIDAVQKEITRLQQIEALAIKVTLCEQSGKKDWNLFERLAKLTGIEWNPVRGPMPEAVAMRLDD